MYITKDWFWLLFGAYCMQILGTIGVLFFPESPRYLIKSGQIDRAITLFNRIAKWNNVDPSLVSE